MLRCILVLLCAWVPLAKAQTRLKLSTIIPGTEQVQLVYNGDFQLQGTASSTNTHPYPLGWARQADMFADPGANMVPADAGVVARALVNNGAPVSKYQCTITLMPATDYILSGYLWNMGDSANHVTTVIDMNDAPGEPQVTLSYSDANADLGYFVYRSFNTTNTGTNIILRAFYDNPVGTGAASRYFPVGAQWDNLAITKASDFVAPAAAGSGTNLPPIVHLTSPPDGTNIVSPGAPVTLQLTASASDPDGSVTNVAFYAGVTRLGQVTTSPYTLSWTIPASGSYQLTVVATDNQGAATVSAPVMVSAAIPAIPSVPALRILPSDTNLTIYWPTFFTAFSLQCATNLAAPDWQIVTNVPAVVGDQFTVTLPPASVQRYFALGTAVDPSTLTGKMLMGYQGWFACPGDGSPMNKWEHWFANQTPTIPNLTVDFWPDVSELDPDELFPTSLSLANGNTAMVYSPWNPKTVLRHFKWMKDNNLDGVFLQRFTSELSTPSNFAWRNGVASNVWAAAETYGRVFGIMYDISGQNESTLLRTLTNDWIYLTGTMHITNSPRYIHHRGKPLVTIWGFGFTSRTNTPSEAQAAIAFFKAAGCTVMGGVPTYWRTLNSDSQTDPAWAAAYRSFDIISPWSVTRFNSISGADTFKTNLIVPDLADCTSRGIDYMPVLFPGFSWYNLEDGTYPLNQIPRLGGTFYWRQAYNAISAHCTMLYGAMFDEMNEGTAMLKMVPNAANLPLGASLVPLNIDGSSNLTSDWYLRLADHASRMLRGEIPLQSQIPITP
ncbi:MAG TPA: Ig-like domain-containing protein [Candidatus Acidoferrum sp.]|nr:Ig-like domain-containing protein [Candidatus Acidoferrum sp.]